MTRTYILDVEDSGRDNGYARLRAYAPRGTAVARLDLAVPLSTPLDVVLNRVAYELSGFVSPPEKRPETVPCFLVSEEGEVHHFTYVTQQSVFHLPIYRGELLMAPTGRWAELRDDSLMNEVTYRLEEVMFAGQSVMIGVPEESSLTHSTAMLKVLERVADKLA